MQDNRLPNDYECDNQMSIYDYLEEPEIDNSLVAVSKVFATAIKQMNLAEWKTFVMALTQIKWTEKNKQYVRLDKIELAKNLGMTSDMDHLSVNLKRAIENLPLHSFLKFENNEGWINGCFITQIACFKNIVRIKFDEDYMSLFEELNKENNYITMWSEDLFKMSSERSILFYEDLRLHSDTRKENSRIYGVKDFKQMFNIPKTGEGSYMRKDGHFARAHFEKRIIEPICKDLAECSMINLILNPDGKSYRKVKNKHGNVLGYEFQWTISTHPKVATAEEVKLLNQNPQDLKIAKDIANGRKKATKADFQQNTYDYDQLEKDFVKN